jgi:hypothetical protein
VVGKGTGDPGNRVPGLSFCIEKAAYPAIIDLSFRGSTSPSPEIEQFYFSRRVP